MYSRPCSPFLIKTVRHDRVVSWGVLAVLLWKNNLSRLDRYSECIPFSFDDVAQRVTDCHNLTYAQMGLAVSAALRILENVARHGKLSLLHLYNRCFLTCI